MKRLVRSRSGREIYGTKWQNLEASSSQNEEDEALYSVAPPVIETNCQPSEGMNGRRIRVSDSHGTMYKATLEGDHVAVEMLLEGDPNLATDEISEDGDRALHIAAAVKHHEIVRKLVEKMSLKDLELLDGNGYTACCYAAITGVVDIVDLMIRKNPTLATSRDRENKTPLYKAAFRGKAKMVSYFLKYVEVEDLPLEEWFDILLVTIRRRMYDLGSEILRKSEQLATMTNDKGTALHMLATQRFFMTRKQRRSGVMRKDMRMLAKKLWEGTQRLGHASAVELMKNPPILHAAAEAGNVELITMLTQTYPDLVWHTDHKGYTIFHIAVIHRQGNLFGLIGEIGARKDLLAVSEDENGNNILHLAAKLGIKGQRSPTPMFPPFQLQRELLWFQRVKAIVPPHCLEMKNREGQTPREVFSKEHKSLIEKNATWTRNTADSWMLISTLIFSVVFASAFAVPGGFNQETGIPVLYKSDWFTCFVILEALAMFFSALSVLHFSRTMMASEEDLFNRLPHMIKRGLLWLSLSVFGAVSVFTSAFFLVYVEERAPLVMSIIITFYITLVTFVFLQNVFFRHGLSRGVFPQGRHSLFKRHADAAHTLGHNKCCRLVLGFLNL